MPARWDTPGCSQEGSAPSLPPLPVELLPLIFANLGGGFSRASKGGLLSCSSVCRTWHEFAIEFLFAEVSLGFYDELIQDSFSSSDPEDVQREVVRPEYPTLSTFLGFLVRNPHIAPRILRLTLTCREYEKEDDADSDFEIHYVSHTTLLAVLRQLPRLQVLKLYNVELVGPASAIHHAAHNGEQVPLRLEELHLKYRERSGDSGFSIALTDVTNTLNLFAEIKMLYLGNARLRLSLSRSVDIPAGLNIQRLVLDDVDHFDILSKALLPTGLLKELKSLDADFIGTRSLRIMKTLLCQLKDTITHFSCSFVSPRRDVVLNSDHRDFDALNLSSCRNLASLGFHLVIYSSRTSQSPSNVLQWACAIRMLSYLQELPASSPPLTVTFTMDATPIENGTIAEQILELWYVIADAEEELLRLVQCKKVLKVMVNIEQWGDYIHRDYAPHIFPKLRAVGILVPWPYAYTE